MDKALRLLQIEQEQAKLGRRPVGEMVPWYQRAVHDDVFRQHQWNLPWYGLNVRISLYISGTNSYPTNTLIGLKVEPKEPIMTFRAAWRGTPWHISVGSTNNDGSLSQEAIAFINAYSEPRILRLRIRNVQDNAITNLAHNDPIVMDPIVHNFWKSSDYKDQDTLHITF